MNPRRAAVAAWVSQPAKRREMIFDYFEAEAEQSRAWATEAPLFGTEADNIADARAIDAAVALLRAVVPARRRR
jgi:hypothetical protein